MFGMKNFWSVPNKAANAFEPVEVIFVDKLRYSIGVGRRRETIRIS